MYDTLIGSPTSEELATLPHLATLPSLTAAKPTDSSRRKSADGGARQRGDMKRSPTNPNPERKRPPDPPPAPPVATPLAPPPPLVPRPLSVSSMASLSSTSSSSVSSCGHIARIRRTGVVHNSAYLASIESLEDASPGRGNASQRRQRSKCDTLSSTGSGDSGVCSPCSFISSASPGVRPRYCDPQLSYTDRVVMEIVETEGVYVSDLQQIIVGYLERWRSSPESSFTEQQLNDLFSNIQDIFHFNKSFLRDLEQCGLDPVKIAQSFVRHNEGFSIYTDYCTHYPRTMSVLTELMRQEAAAKLFRERQIALQHTLPLGSYLLKPVQRILKYHLLLNNIVKQCSPEQAGYPDIQQALSTMTSIAQHINLMKRRHEHAVRVQEIQSLLLGWLGEDLTTFGELCAEGAFRMAGAKALRHAFLFDRMLLVTKKKEEGVLGYKAHIMCSNLMLIESVPGEPLSFHVIPFDNPKFQYTLQARNLEQKREWCLQLKKVILENYNAVIPSHARQLVMQLGQNKAGDEELAEKHSTPKRQHSAPEYLERRKQEKNRRKSELCLLRNRFQPRVMRKSDVGTTAKSRQEISRSVLLQESKQEESVVHTEMCAGEEAKDASLSGETSDPASPAQAPPPSLEEEHKTLETIISALLMQNGEFVKFVNKTRRQPRRRVPNTSEDEEGDYDNLAWPDSPRMRRIVSPVPSPKLVQRSGLVRRAHSFSSHETDNSSPDSSLSRFSLDQSGAENNTSLWVKHQAVSEGNKKSDSLPRSFQIGGVQSPDWSVAARPITIASDKAQELNLVDMENYINRAEAMCAGRRGNCFPTNLEYTTEEETSVSDLSSQQLYVHPEYRIYKSGLSKTMLRHVINKISSLRSTETLHHPDPRPAKPPPPSPSPCYMQGSPRLGARIAHCSDSSDYADPRALFPAITPSRKAASVLGIRPCTGSSLSVATLRPEPSPSRQDSEQSDSLKQDYGSKASEKFDCTSRRMSAGKEADKSNPLKQINESKLNELRLKLNQTRIDGHEKDKCQVEEDACSVGSADSFYERSFEAIENSEAELFRDSAVFSDQEDAFSDDLDLRIPPPREFDTLPPPTPFETKVDTPPFSHSRTEQVTTPTEHHTAPVSSTSVREQSTREESKPPTESHTFRGECEVSTADRKPQSKLDICKPRRDKLCIVKPLMSLSNPLDHVTPRSRKLIQISKVSLNSIPDLEVRYSEKYIRGEDARSNSCQCSAKSMQSRRHSCKSVDSSSFFTTCHKCKPSQTDVMSKSCDFGLTSRENFKAFGFTSKDSCKDCIHCASRDVVCSSCCKQCNSDVVRCCSQCSVASEDSSSASTVVEVSPTRQGWVKHVVNRLQSF